MERCTVSVIEGSREDSISTIHQTCSCMPAIPFILAEVHLFVPQSSVHVVVHCRYAIRNRALAHSNPYALE